MRAICLLTALALGGCSRATAPKAMTAGKVISISSVAGLIASAFVYRYLGEAGKPIVAGFSILSGVGIGLYAAGELTGPNEIEETLSERHRRWARILTGRAYGYARDGRCPRVRHIETRVRVYDRELHDFVFMRDPEIQKCLTAPVDVAPAAEPPPEPPAQQPETSDDPL
ncbi:MAG: hypothetical protein H0V17_03180 [Deltaproteobacteria bacterium]|nr:hypothetical protein [Deltaproteobacteria bacterium]